MEESEVGTTSVEDNAADEPVSQLPRHGKRVKRPPASFSDGGFATAPTPGRKGIVGNSHHGKSGVSVVKRPPKPPLSSCALLVQNKIAPPSGKGIFL